MIMTILLNIYACLKNDQDGS